MTEESASPPGSGARASTQRFRIGALIVIALAVGLVVWLVVRDRGGSASPPSNVTAVSPTQLRTLAGSVAHPVFWVGPKSGMTYELTRTSNGSIFVRYLPSGVKIGSKDPYLTVATYPFPGAFPALQ